MQMQRFLARLDKSGERVLCGGDSCGMPLALVVSEGTDRVIWFGKFWGYSHKAAVWRVSRTQLSSNLGPVLVHIPLDGREIVESIDITLLKPHQKTSESSQGMSLPNVSIARLYPTSINGSVPALPKSPILLAFWDAFLGCRGYEAEEWTGEASQHTGDGLRPGVLALFPRPRI